VACDALITPIVTGDVDLGALDELVRLCLQLAGHGAHCAPEQDPDPPTGLQQLTAMSREALQQAIIGKTTILLLHYRSGA
jgi:hypothetical protein